MNVPLTIAFARSKMLFVLASATKSHERFWTAKLRARLQDRPG
jgi:hypothetical protein